MLKHVEARFLGATERSAPDGRKIYKAIATTAALDRYGEVVLPMGCDDKHFKNNPVLVAIHDSRQVTIGHLESWDITKDAITVELTFTQDELGQTFEQRYINRDMNAFSIGFRPKANGVTEIWSPWGGKPPEVKSMEFKLPNGETHVLDFTNMEQIPFSVYTHWDWLELSPVPIPANPEALLLREANDIISRAYSGSTVMRSFVQEKVKGELQPILDALKKFTDKSEIDFKIDGAVPSHSCEMDEESTWSGSAAKTELAKWASSDGSGDKDKINWNKFSKGFGWFDSEKADAITSYKLPHHMPKEMDDMMEEGMKAASDSAGLECVWRGLTAAMAALLGARGGADVGEDKAAVYRHLARHYKDAGKEPPPLEKDFTPEEIKSIEEGSWGEARAEQVSQGDPTEEITEAKAEETPTKAQINLEEAIKSLGVLVKSVRDLAESVDEHFINLSIRMTMVEERVGATPGPAKKADPKTVQDSPVAEQEGTPATVPASLVEKLASFTA
jgi:hypothetical protein